MINALARNSVLFAVIIVLSALVGAPAQAANSDRCRTASQCHGPLPQICMRCSNGIQHVRIGPACTTSARCRSAAATLLATSPPRTDVSLSGRAPSRQ